MVMIDTHILLWVFSDSGRLTASARDAIDRNDVCVSIASLWEMAIKASLKREDKRLELLNPFKILRIPVQRRESILFRSPRRIVNESELCRIITRTRLIALSWRRPLREISP